ncbi:uroporphyrinogen-III C-methyltransferase [Stenoxybacter acetivorans]|uniref:uroporphyrinogen-III C-methyltransferase n=1 Tax=Stenoxybacter acetivorans TaxID=422441 RepID=UPI00068D7C38|nr:uroporphyrinogen-III C-methyltransferase [Stenoxybacter acetivorans]
MSESTNNTLPPESADSSDAAQNLPVNAESEKLAADNQRPTPLPTFVKHTEKTMSDTPNNIPAAPIVIKQSSGKGMALGALVLSLLALGAAGFLFVEGQNVLKRQEISFDQKFQTVGENGSKSIDLAQHNLSKIELISQELQTLQNNSKQQAEQVNAVQKAYQELIKSRSDWLVDEIEATLNLAAQQLIISGNVPTTVQVLENLETRLARFDQPQLLPIKQAVSNDLNQLKSQPYLDTAGVSLRLNRLETAVSSLPLVIDDTLQPKASVTAPILSDPTAPWWRWAWQKTWQSLAGMVEVRRLNSNDSMLMSPEQTYFVRENLRLRLLDARIALIQHNSEIYAGDLNAAQAAVNQYFDTQSPQTQSWLNELTQIRDLDIQNSPKNNMLAESLAAVRAYQKQANMVSNIDAASEPSQASESIAEGAAAGEQAASAAYVQPLPKPLSENAASGSRTEGRAL